MRLCPTELRVWSCVGRMRVDGVRACGVWCVCVCVCSAWSCTAAGTRRRVASRVGSGRGTCGPCGLLYVCRAVSSCRPVGGNSQQQHSTEYTPPPLGARLARSGAHGRGQGSSQSDTSVLPHTPHHTHTTHTEKLKWSIFQHALQCPTAEQIAKEMAAVRSSWVSHKVRP